MGNAHTDPLARAKADALRSINEEIGRETIDRLRRDAGARIDDYPISHSMRSAVDELRMQGYGGKESEPTIPGATVYEGAFWLMHPDVKDALYEVLGENWPDVVVPDDGMLSFQGYDILTSEACDREAVLLIDDAALEMRPELLRGTPSMDDYPPEHPFRVHAELPFIVRDSDGIVEVVV